MEYVTIKMKSSGNEININGHISVDMSVDVIDMLVTDVFSKIQSGTSKNYVRQQLISAINQSFDYSVLTNNSMPLTRL
tara:strand:- start:317 stop:550 length:234 start_codon:yes stop_codon:yes gene_type:complete